MRKQIASLQCELTEKASCAVGMFKMAQLGQQLRWHKFRLELLEDCLAGLSEGRAMTSKDCLADEPQGNGAISPALSRSIS
ncbi:hypothetical protein ACFX5Q_19055 [Mesorhizobium sp. IMUNJ 23033]|uniref:hypothetical protein n=1 Tax=Mesorhizobium sp. IMUNJ 23033 TaxID=3378039 RepID=UPI00384D3F02